MLTSEYVEELPNGNIKLHRTFNFDNEIKDLDERRKDIGKGFSQTKELRHTMRIPNELRVIDPLVDEFCKHPNDKVLKRLVLAKYPKLKVCDGGIR